MNKKCAYPGCNKIIPKGNKHCKIHIKTDIYHNAEWKRIRDLKLFIFDQCEKCGSKEDLQVHHITPLSVDKKLLTDWLNLMTLCKKCHYKIHYL